MSTPWWREAVVYEVYVRAFADSDGDGVGDLPGVRARLPYLRDLGVDALWLTPFYPSPQRDHGYDVTDHRDVDPRFGTLDDLDGLLADAHALGLRVLVDVVANHVSCDHPWFVAARAAGPGSPERARFHVVRGRGPDGSEPPANWPSLFGGPAWEPLGDGDWYLHVFDVSQPDLDWTHPDVRAGYADVLRFWLDRGVDGFRFDAAGVLAKDPAYADLAPGVEPGDPGHPYADRPEVRDVHRCWADVLAPYGPERFGVAETWGPPEVVEPYLRPGGLGQAFGMDLVFAPFEATVLRRLLDGYLAAATRHGRLPAWVLGSHDVTRAATRFGPDGARAMLLLLLAAPGAVYLYAGDELGLPEVDLPDEARRDPTFTRSGGADRGRDGCRVPLPWSGTSPPYGFTGGGATPWLPQPETWAELTAAVQQDDPASMLAFTRRALTLRPEHWRGTGDTVTWHDAPDGVLAFSRGGTATCVVNTTDQPIPLHRYEGAPALASAPCDEVTLPARAAVWLEATADRCQPHEQGAKPRAMGGQG